MAFDRDLKLFKALAAGPVVCDFLHKYVFLKEDGKPLAKRVFNRAVLKLESAEYLKIRTYKDRSNKSGIVRVVALQERGANTLCANYPDLDRENIRTYMPKPAHLSHELNLTQIIWKITDEEKNGLFKIESLRDEAAQKRWLMHVWRSISKGMYFPDITVRAIPIEGKSSFTQPMTVYIELDCGSKSKSYWIRKISSWNIPTVLITLKKERLGFWSDCTGEVQLKERLWIVAHNDFKAIGLAPWLKYLERKPGVYLIVN